MLVAQEVNNGRSSVPLLLVLCSSLPEPTSPISPHRLKDQEQWGHYWFSLLLLSSCLGVWQCLLCSGSFVNCITPLIFLSDIGGRTMKLLCQRQRSRKLLLQENVRSWQKKRLRWAGMNCWMNWGFGSDFFSAFVLRPLFADHSTCYCVRFSLIDFPSNCLPLWRGWQLPSLKRSSPTFQTHIMHYI